VRPYTLDFAQTGEEKIIHVPNIVRVKYRSGLGQITLRTDNEEAEADPGDMISFGGKSNQLRVIADTDDRQTVKLVVMQYDGAKIESGAGQVKVTQMPPVSINNTVDIEGNVAVDNFPASQTVDGTVAVSNQPTEIAINNFPGTQHVSGNVLVTGFSGHMPIFGFMQGAYKSLHNVVVTEANTRTLVKVNAQSGKNQFDLGETDRLFIHHSGYSHTDNTTTNKVYVILSKTVLASNTYTTLNEFLNFCPIAVLEPGQTLELQDVRSDGHLYLTGEYNQSLPKTQVTFLDSSLY